MFVDETGKELGVWATVHGRECIHCAEAPSQGSKWG